MKNLNLFNPSHVSYVNLMKLNIGLTAGNNRTKMKNLISNCELPKLNIWF